MQITIDTTKDTVDELIAAKELLIHLIEKKSGNPSQYTQVQNEGLFDMFSEKQEQPIVKKQEEERYPQIEPYN